MRITLLLLLVACKGEPTHVGSCQAMPTACEEYKSKDEKYVERQKAGCTSTWSASGCPLENRTASCVESRNNWTRTTHYYTPVDDKMKVACGAYGTWASH